MVRRDASGVVEIDGSVGEGGGQMLRSALGLSMVTGTPFRMVKIRAKRSRPGLLRQHATSVEAARQVSNADVDGLELGSQTLVFRPRAPKAGSYELAIGTAGATMLVLHAILPALLAAEGESEVRLSGGTDAMAAPPVDHVEKVYLRWLHAMGIEAELVVERRGYYPAGGGRVVFRVRGGSLRPFEHLERGAHRATRVVCRVAGSVPHVVAERELGTIGARLGLERREMVADFVDSLGPGNTLHAELEFEHGMELLSVVGRREVSSEHVANELANHVDRFLAADVPYYEHSADQLMLLMALAGRGAYRTVALTEHSTTQAKILEAFLPARVTTSTEGRAVTVRIA